MKPILEKIKTGTEASFVCRQFKGNGYPFNWHFHPEFELTIILESSGKRFVGDNISAYQKGDLVLLGPNLPHTWFTDPTNAQETINGTESIVYQFSQNFLGEELWGKPEFIKIKSLLTLSQRGVFFPAEVFQKNKSILEEILKLKSFEQLLVLLKLLSNLADEKNFNLLSSVSFNQQASGKHQNRMDKVFQFTHENYLKENINQKVVAKIVSMSESNFCHFFKKATGKTFTNYLNELRIGFACKKLIDTDETIVNICYQSGFQNLSNFNRQFLSQKKCSPKQFRKQWVTIN